jgi:cytosine permease
MANGTLPGYLASAKPNPAANRAPWYKNTAQVYAGIMLWFVFWNQIPVGMGLKGADGWSGFAGGTLAQGLGVAFLGLILAALVCYLLFYLVPGMLGMKTGLPLYIVGTSTYGAQGGFLMPGFLMGVLQFGWLAVNAFFAGILLCAPFGYGFPSVPHTVVASLWAIAGAFMGLKGIKYVARVATFLPLIPLVILIILFVATVGGIGSFDTQALIAAGKQFTPASGQPILAKASLSTFGVVALLATYIVGFFATAGAAGVDIAMNTRNGKDVQLGGLVGVTLATVVAGGLSLLIIAGAYGSNLVGNGGVMQTTNLMSNIVGSKVGIAFMFLLAIAAFPAACFSAFIAANSFKATLPKVNPFISCGLGTAVAILLAVKGWAGDAIGVFTIIGASFGPVCGAMMADYLLAGRKWAGPRAGFNMAGWISWVIGFAVGAVEFIAKIPGLEGLAGKVPCPPVAAFIVGFVLYIVLAKIGLQGKTLDMPAEA